MSLQYDLPLVLVQHGCYAHLELIFTIEHDSCVLMANSEMYKCCENVCIQVVVDPCDEYCRLGHLLVMESLNIFVVAMQAMFETCYACVRQFKRISRNNLQLCWFPMTLPISHYLQVISVYCSGFEFILKTHAKMFKNP
jgi:hypothetical protein